MSTLVEPLLFNIDDYLRMAEAGIFARDGGNRQQRFELIHGEIVPMSPIGNPQQLV